MEFEYYYGTLRITNPNTLKEWIDNGKYKELIDNGWVFGTGCGRFRNEKCTCSQCRSNARPKLLKVIEETLT